MTLTVNLGGYCYCHARSWSPKQPLGKRRDDILGFLITTIITTVTHIHIHKLLLSTVHVQLIISKVIVSLDILFKINLSYLKIFFAFYQKI